MRKRAVTSKVQQKINSLTSNEDYRQELWLHYISGNPLSTFEQKLESIRNERIKQQKFLDALSNLYNNPPSAGILHTLSAFSQFERSILFLLLLGFTVTEVSEYKGISCIRIEQSISSIKQHTAWKKYGVKE